MNAQPSHPGNQFAAGIVWEPEYQSEWDDPRAYGGYASGDYDAEADLVPADHPSLLLGTWEDRPRRIKVRIWVTRAQWEGPPTAELPYFQAALIVNNRTRQVFDDRDSLQRMLATISCAVPG